MLFYLYFFGNNVFKYVNNSDLILFLYAYIMLNN